MKTQKKVEELQNETERYRDEIETFSTAAMCL